MNAVDAFSAQMRTIGYGGPTPTPPTWPNGAPANPSAPVPPAQPVGQPQQPASQGYWYALPAGNPERLTVAQVVAKAYKLDPDRDKAQIDQIANYVAQQNGIMLSNWPIPSNVSGLRLPWAPTGEGSGTKEEKKKKKGPNFGQVLGVITTVASGAARIFARHQAHDQGLPTNPYGYPQYGQPGYGQPSGGNRDIDLIAGDIADAVPIIANIGAILSGNAPPAGYGQPGYPYGQPGHGYPQPGYGQPSSPIPTTVYQPTTPGYQQPTYGQPPVYQPPVYQPPAYQAPQPYNPPVYQPPTYQAPQPYVPPTYQPPAYQAPQPYVPPGYQQPTYGQQPGHGQTYGTMGGDAWGQQVGTIVNGVSQLAQSLGQIFGKR